MKLHIEYPYDVGSPHELVGENGEKAVISAEAAGALLSMGIPDKAPGVEPPEILVFAPKLSKKAKSMLGFVEGTERGPQMPRKLNVNRLFGGAAHGPRRQRRLDS